MHSNRGNSERSARIEPLAQDYVELIRSPAPDRVYCGSPGICVLESGRIVVTDGLRGPGLLDVLSPEQQTRITHAKREISGATWLGKVMISDDGGDRFRETGEYPMMHQRPFVSGDSVYVLGHDDDLKIMRSDDAGETWSEPVSLTDGEKWHQAPSNVWYANGCVYLVMEKRVTFDIEGWYPGELAPVLLRGRVGSDLTKVENWTFASELSFRDTIPGIETEPEIDFAGVPFFDTSYPRGVQVAETRVDRHSAPIGWLESNVVQFSDPDHLWHDPSGRTFYLWMRAHTGGSGYACIAKAVEEQAGDGAITTELATVPSGKRQLYIPCPGGQMKFHVIYDRPTSRYWLLSTQATDSMCRPDRLPKDRYNLPNNERRRLQLHFSKNMVDWCFAGLVCAGSSEAESRHYAAMAVRGDDLLVVSRSGSPESKSAHDNDMSTFHRIDGFRDLVY